MTGCIAKFVAAILDAEPNDDKMYRSWSLLPFILPTGNYQEEMRRAHILVHSSFYVALDVLKMEHSPQHPMSSKTHQKHIDWLQFALEKNSSPPELVEDKLYSKQRTVTNPGYVLGAVYSRYEAPMVQAPPHSEFKWMYDRIQHLKWQVLLKPYHADIWGLRGNYREKESASPSNAGEYAGKCFAAYAQLVGNRGYDLAVSALKGIQHEG